MNTEYCSCFGKSFFKAGVSEKDSKKCIRLDYNTDFTRLYNVEALQNRIFREAYRNDLKCKLLFINSDEDIKLEDDVDTFIYLHFCLILEKI